MIRLSDAKKTNHYKEKVKKEGSRLQSVLKRNLAPLEATHQSCSSNTRLVAFMRWYVMVVLWSSIKLFKAKGVLFSANIVMTYRERERALERERQMLPFSQARWGCKWAGQRIGLVSLSLSLSLSIFLSLIYLIYIYCIRRKQRFLVTDCDMSFTP